MARLNLTTKQSIAFHEALQHDNEEIYATLAKQSTSKSDKRLLALYNQLINEHAFQASTLQMIYDDQD